MDLPCQAGEAGWLRLPIGPIEAREEGVLSPWERNGLGDWAKGLMSWGGAAWPRPGCCQNPLYPETGGAILRWDKLDEQVTGETRRTKGKTGGGMDHLGCMLEVAETIWAELICCMLCKAFSLWAASRYE